MGKRGWLALAAVGALLVSWAALRRGPGAEEGKPAPPFRLSDVSGQTATLAQFEGRVVLLDFWATWCGTCAEELPDLRRLYAKHRGPGFELLAASVDEEGRKALLPYIAQNAIPWRVLLSDAATAEAYSVRGLPMKYLIDGRGIVARKYVGPVPPGELERDVAALLKERS